MGKHGAEYSHDWLHWVPWLKVSLDTEGRAWSRSWSRNWPHCMSMCVAVASLMAVAVLSSAVDT